MIINIIPLIFGSLFVSLFNLWLVHGILEASDTICGYFKDECKAKKRRLILYTWVPGINVLFLSLMFFCSCIYFAYKAGKHIVNLSKFEKL